MPRLNLLTRLGAGQPDNDSGQAGKDGQPDNDSGQAAKDGQALRLQAKERKMKKNENVAFPEPQDSW